jgi:hypothetical protein
VAELAYVGRGERKAVEEGTALRVGGIGIIDRKHDAVDAKRQQRRNEWRLAKHTAGRQPNLVEDGAGDRPLQAVYVDKVLKGANPAELSVEGVTPYELIVNLKTARDIGVTMPPEVLKRADRVIQ